ncbi:MAG: type IV pilus modification PilV family protein [Vicinamibacterales bacterium]
MAKFSSSNDRGFSLAEVVVAIGITTSALLALAQLFAMAISANTAAKNTTFATVLAEQKLEQLRALAWGFDPLGLPLTDTTTNTAVDPEAPVGGTGLTPSPGTALQQNTPGWVDYIDRNGRIVGSDAIPPASALYFRRWSVEPLPTNPNNTIIIQVLVGPIRDRGAADEGRVGRLGQEARVATVKTRKSQ